jgi:hypothetical protein
LLNALEMAARAEMHSSEYNDSRFKFLKSIRRRSWGQDIHFSDGSPDR